VSIKEVLVARIEGKVAIITGGASGIGRATCLILAKEGAKVAVTDISDDAGKKVVSEVEKNGGVADYWHMNVTDEKEIEKVFADINTKYGRVDILVNNAGIAGPPKATHELTTEEWNKVIDINLKGVFFCTKYVYKYLKMAGGGSIVNMSSMLGLIGGEDPVYHASKGGVRLMTKSDASIYAKDNIRVNSVHPGYILTPLFESIGARNIKGAEAFFKELTSEIPLGRLGKPEDVAKGILFLASDESSYITGTELVIDGGYIVR
jgi:NAD(P)-dependent dehydrogenase (short-subunit alcohol dehydrogenase family)